jgi:pyruvoyl-dependent arginine decarboxylase (PvlArgDC)
MKRIALMLLAAAFLSSVSVAAPKSTKMNGWVSDEKCGVKDIDNADCAKKCAESGSKLVFVSEKDKSVINVDNPDALKGQEGHHVNVTGTVDNGTLHVTKLTMLRQSDEKTK